MRLFKNIFIIVFVLATLYIVKDDVVHFFNNIKTGSPSFLEPRQVVDTAGGDQAPKTLLQKIQDVIPLKVAHPVVEKTASSIDSDEVVRLVNIERTSRGLKPYRTESKLGASAQLKVDDMIAKNYFEHVSPSGQSVSDLVRKTGYEYIAIGENLAKGDFASASALVKAWMDSPGHRANILSEKFVDIGVAIGTATEDGQLIIYAIQHFGSPRSICSQSDEKLKAEIEALKAELKAFDQTLSAQKQQIDSYTGDKNSQEHQTLIVSYNALVKNYNTLTGETKQKVLQYNTEVSSINICIKENS